MTLRELRDKRGSTVAAARAILDAAEKEKRDLTDDESAKYDEIFGESEKLRKQIAREERQVEIEREIAEAAVRAGEGTRGNDGS
ncbi:MAG: phage major capsid protein, partial [Alphaproteobacteria bacterium]